MGSLDLTRVRGVLDDLIFEGSELVVTEDNGVVDDTLDEDSGDLTAVGDSQLYTGPGLVQPLASASAGGQVPDLGIAVTPNDSETTHRMLLPLTAPGGISVGSDVTVSKVNPLVGDVQLVGRQFEVTEVPTNASVSVMRIAFLKPLRPKVAATPEPEED